MNLTIQSGIIMALLSIFACKSDPEQATVKDVDLNRYMGRWYEIARLPNSFERGLECITANYTLRPDGKVTVLNKGKGEKGWESAKGLAKIPDKNEPGKLKVSFFRPFWGPYWILELDPDYNYVLIGSPSRNYMWILCRQPEMDSGTYDKLVEKANSLGYETSLIIKPRQDCIQP